MSHSTEDSSEPSRKRIHLENELPVINPCYDSPTALQRIRQFILDASSFNDSVDGAWHDTESGARCFATPFPVIQLPRFFATTTTSSTSDTFADALQDELKSVPLQHRSNDLYDFYQSWDAQALSGKHIQGLRSVIASAPTLRLIETILGLEPHQLIEDRVDLAAQRYERGGYLLCHDDDIKEEVTLGVARRVAFVYYLVDATWSTSDGGALALFNTLSDNEGQPDRVVRQLLPERGALVLFRVGETSWHQVEEVHSRLADRARWSVTGWLYGPIRNTSNTTNTSVTRPNPLVSILPQYIPLQMEQSLSHWICPDYLTLEAKQRILQQFTDESVVQLKEFIRTDKRVELAKAIQVICHYTHAHHDIQPWQMNGPASLRRYAQFNKSTINSDVNDVTTTQAMQLLDDFDVFLQSKSLVEYFQDITGLSMTTTESNGVYGQIRRIVHGDYTLLRDDWKEPSGLDAVLHILVTPDSNNTPDAITWHDDNTDNEIAWQGAYHYINEEDGDLLATLTPIDNALTLVYRDEGVARFLKYSLQDDDMVERLDAIYTYAVDFTDDTDE